MDGPGPHPTTEDLADLDEGLLDEPRRGDVQSHLGGCAQCQAAQGSLAAVRTRLAAVPAEPMPSDVTTRLEAALAAQDVQPDDASGHSADASGTPAAGTVVPLDVARARRWAAPSFAAAAASVVVLLAIGAVVVGHLRHTSSGATAGTAASSAVSSLQPQVGARFFISATGRGYTPANLSTRVQALLAGGASTAVATVAPSAPTPSSPTADRAGRRAAVPAQLRPLQSSSALLECVQYLTGSPLARPQAVDLARWTYGQYHGAPSAVIVIPRSVGVVEVYVAGPSCSGATAIRTYQIVHLPA